MLVNAIRARKIFNSRKEGTIAVAVETKQGKYEASAPGGKSKGKYEASAFSSKGINFSIAFVNAIGKLLEEKKIILNEFSDLYKVEELVKDYEKKIDKKSHDWDLIGANALYALESALLKAIAASYGQEIWQLLCEKPKILPRPLGNIIGGGMHTKQEEKTDIQEFLFLPKTKNFFDAYFINLQAYNLTKKKLKEKDKRWEGNLTDELAFASTLSNETVLALLNEVKEGIQKKFNIDAGIGVDIAASSLWNGIKYCYKNKKKRLGKNEQINYILELIKKYSLEYVEDPLHEEDFEGFSRLLRLTKQDKQNKCLIVGDDLICTQKERLLKAISEKSINALIVKPNQNGSLLSVKEVVDIAKKNNIACIISHRSGETVDNTIAHLAVGWQIPIIKTGVLGKERFSKLHTLLKIERQVGNSLKTRN